MTDPIIPPYPAEPTLTVEGAGVEEDTYESAREKAAKVGAYCYRHRTWFCDCLKAATPPPQSEPTPAAPLPGIAPAMRRVDGGYVREDAHPGVGEPDWKAEAARLAGQVVALQGARHRTAEVLAQCRRARNISGNSVYEAVDLANEARDATNHNARLLGEVRAEVERLKADVAWCSCGDAIGVRNGGKCGNCLAGIDFDATCATLPCGHPASLALRSVESPTVLCELCEARSAARDAEKMEASLREELTAAREDLEEMEQDDAAADKALIAAGASGPTSLAQRIKAIAAERDSLRAEVERLKAAGSAPAAAIHVIARSEPQPPGITNGAVENGPEEAIQVIAPATTGPGPVCGAWHAKSESACILAPHAHGVHVGDYSGEGDLFTFAGAAVTPSPAPASKGEDIAPGHTVRTVTADETGTLCIIAPGFTTIRACSDCGVLMTGGPTRCLFCAGRAAPASTGFWRCEECGEANDSQGAGPWRFNGRIWQHYCPGRHPQAGPADAKRMDAPASTGAGGEEAKAPCGGTRCYQSADGQWFHSTKSYASCSWWRGGVTL